MNYLWRWSVKADEWEFVAQATDGNTETVLRGYKRRDRKGARFRWTRNFDRPRKFRARGKKERI